MRANKSRFFLDVLPYIHSTSSCRCFVFLCRRDMRIMVFQFSIKPARWVTFRGSFGGVGVGVLLESCDSSDDDSGVDTSFLVRTRFSLTSTT
jgi:hypothetical protein